MEKRERKRWAVIEGEASWDEGLDERLNNEEEFTLKGRSRAVYLGQSQCLLLYSWPVHCEKGTLGLSAPTEIYADDPNWDISNAPQYF